MLPISYNIFFHLGLGLTEDGAGGHGLPVEPERDLGQDDGHEAWHVGLDHKVADLPLQVEVTHHHRVLTCVTHAHAHTHRRTHTHTQTQAHMYT